VNKPSVKTVTLHSRHNYVTCPLKENPQLEISLLQQLSRNLPKLGLNKRREEDINVEYLSDWWGHNVKTEGKALFFIALKTISLDTI
jgi:hypothetical protein